jgi:hypothetical protein
MDVWQYLDPAPIPVWVRDRLAALGAEQIWDWEAWRTLLVTQLPGLGVRLIERLPGCGGDRLLLTPPY